MVPNALPLVIDRAFGILSDILEPARQLRRGRKTQVTLQESFAKLDIRSGMWSYSHGGLLRMGKREPKIVTERRYVKSG